MQITSVQFVPSAQFLYSASADKSICLFDLKAEKMTDRLTQFESHVTDLDVAGDSLITVTQDGRIMEFSISQGTKALRNVKSNEATSVATSPDKTKFAVGHVNGSVSVWDVGTFKKIDTTQVHSHAVSDIRFFANDKVMSSGDDGGLAVLTVQ
jgi:WD40 repeat protein